MQRTISCPNCPLTMRTIRSMSELCSMYVWHGFTCWNFCRQLIIERSFCSVSWSRWTSAFESSQSRWKISHCLDSVFTSNSVFNDMLASILTGETKFTRSWVILNESKTMKSRKYRALTLHMHLFPPLFAIYLVLIIYLNKKFTLSPVMLWLELGQKYIISNICVFIVRLFIVTLIIWESHHVEEYCKPSWNLPLW